MAASEVASTSGQHCDSSFWRSSDEFVMSTGNGTQASFSVIRRTEAQRKPETFKPWTPNLGFQQLALAVAKFRWACQPLPQTLRGFHKWGIEPDIVRSSQQGRPKKGAHKFLKTSMWVHCSELHASFMFGRCYWQVGQERDWV